MVLLFLYPPKFSLLKIAVSPKFLLQKIAVSPKFSLLNVLMYYHRKADMYLL